MKKKGSKKRKTPLPAKQKRRRKRRRKISVNSWSMACVILFLLALICIPYIKDKASKDKGSRIPIGAYAYGIDISHYQPEIVWDSLMVLTDRNGRTIRSATKAKEIKPVSFVFIKASEGISLKDKHFDGYWECAGKSGIKRGAYHFFRSSKDPVLQAENFIRATGKLHHDDLPPVLDIETMHRGCSKDELNRNALIWLRTVEKHYGRKPIVYSSAHFIRDNLNNEITDNYRIWVAHYEKSCPDYKEWDIWQCTDRGVIYGIKGHTDINVCRKEILDSL